MQFRAESFNLFNLPQFGQPNENIGNGGVARLLQSWEIRGRCRSRCV
jgi:hypothetical protein